MEKIVSPGERVTTITLNGTENKVTFESDYPYFYVTNFSSSDVYASFESGSTADVDGVYTIPAGSTRPLKSDNTDTLYITGSGKVQIEATRVPILGFKYGQKGGESGETIVMGCTEFWGISADINIGSIETE